MQITSRPPMPLPDRAVLYTREGDAWRQTPMYTVWDPTHTETFTDARGRQGTLFAGLSDGVAMTAIDAEGQPVLTAVPADRTSTRARQILDDARHRLVLLDRQRLDVYDLHSGERIAQRPVVDGDLADVALAPDGTLYAAGKGGVRRLDDALADAWRSPVEGFIPSGVRVLGDGSLLTSGSCFLRDGRILSGFDTKFAVVGPDGAIRDTGVADGPLTPAPDGRVYAWRDRSVEIHRAGAATQKHPLEKADKISPTCDALAPIADGGYIVLHDTHHRPKLSVYDAEGTRIRTVTFPQSDLEHLVVSPDGLHAWVSARNLVGPNAPNTDLVAVDLTRSSSPLAAVLPAPIEPAAVPVFSQKKYFVPAVLEDGRVLLTGPEGDEVLDADGHVAADQTLPSPSSKVITGPGQSCTLETFLRDEHARAGMRRQRVAVAPVPTCGTPPAEPPVPDASSEALQQLFRRGAQEGEWRFPGDDGAMVRNGNALLTPANQKLTLEPGEDVADVLPVKVDAHRYAAVGTTHGRVVWLDGDLPTQAERAAYTMPAPVQHLWATDDGRIAARAQDGSVLVLERGFPSAGPLRTADPPPVVTPPDPAVIHQDEEHVWIGGIRVDKRHEG